MYTRAHFINLVSDIWEGGGFSAEYKCLPSIQRNASDGHHMGLPFGSQWMLCGPLVGKIPFLMSKAFFELWIKLEKLSEKIPFPRPKGF